MTISIVEKLSVPGAPERPNEDALGSVARGAFVIDGATGLSDTPIMAPDHAPTDAAWLADFAATRFLERMNTAPSLPEMIRLICSEARAVFFAAGGADAPRYGWPTAGFQIIRHRPDGVLETAGLGDCRLLLQDASGAVIEASGPQFDRAREQAAARRAIARTGGFAAKATLRDPETLAGLRESRSRQNTPGGYWTLGLEPEAADHLASSTLLLDAPARGLLASDGFVDLIDLYGAYDAAGLIEAAFTDGLELLVAEIRRFEREVDPDGARFPRFKQSDDSTAVAFTIT